MRNPLLAARLFGVPLLAHPEKAAIVADVFLRHGGYASLAPTVADRFSQRERAGLEGDLIAGVLDRRGVDPFPVVDGIAVMAVEGTLVNRGAWIGAESGMTSYQGVQAQVQRAMRSDRIRAVVLDLDSPGGEVPGAFETAGMIRELSAAKPTLAIVNSTADSGGYLLASQARRIVLAEDGEVGSIGAMMMHVNRGRQLANEGIEVTFVHAGARKVEGNSTEPLPDGLRAEMQAKVDGTRRRFVDAVVAGRRGRISADAAMATEAATFFGPEALALGLVDAVAEPSAAFAAFRAALNGA